MGRKKQTKQKSHSLPGVCIEVCALWYQIKKKKKHRAPRFTAKCFCFSWRPPRLQETRICDESDTLRCCSEHKNGTGGRDGWVDRLLCTVTVECGGVWDGRSMSAAWCGVGLCGRDLNTRSAPKERSRAVSRLTPSHRGQAGRVAAFASQIVTKGHNHSEKHVEKKCNCTCQFHETPTPVHNGKLRSGKGSVA